VIHTDIEGFIKGSGFEDMVELGTFQLQSKGVLRLEGKEYRVQEGDVILLGSMHKPGFEVAERVFLR
jgi:ribosome-binding ATPase YchF (GTP1/OBG family)